MDEQFLCQSVMMYRKSIFSKSWNRSQGWREPIQTSVFLGLFIPRFRIKLVFEFALLFYTFSLLLHSAFLRLILYMCILRMEAPPLLRQVKTQHFKHLVDFSGDLPIDLNPPSSIFSGCRKGLFAKCLKMVEWSELLGLIHVAPMVRLV